MDERVKATTLLPMINIGGGMVPAEYIRIPWIGYDEPLRWTFRPHWTQWREIWDERNWILLGWLKVSSGPKYKSCEICGDTFQIRPSTQTKKYCSKPCAGIGRTRMKQQEWLQEYFDVYGDNDE